MKCFDYDLYWVGYKDAAPASHVREKLLAGGKNARFLPGHDADSFFVELAQKLDCFPPPFVEDPFSHLESLFADLTEFKHALGESTIDVMAKPRSLIVRAKEIQEIPDDTQAGKAEQEAIPLYMAGQYEQAITLLESVSDLSEEGKDALIWAYNAHAGLLHREAEIKVGDEADRQFEAAFKKYELALAIEPDMNETLYNWGNTLVAMARTKSGDAADRLFKAASEKYKQALAIKPDMYEALNNWGSAFSAQARTKSGDAANRLFETAYQKYSQALAIKSDRHQVLVNWGIGLSVQAKTKSGDAANRLFESAAQKFEQAVVIKPDMHEALNGWGATLIMQAANKSGADQAELLVRAVEILERGEAVGSKTALYNLACAHAHLGGNVKVEHYLRSAKQHGTLLDRDHIESDADFDAVRDQVWFKELLDELAPAG